MGRPAPWLITTLSAGLVLAAWVAATSGGLVSDLFLPGPGEVWDAFGELGREG